MKKVTEAATSAIITREALNLLSFRDLQAATKAENLNTHLGRTAFSKDMLIENLLNVGKNNVSIGASTESGYTKDELVGLDEKALRFIVKQLGFKPAKDASRDALIETILTYKGPAAVFTAPAEKKGAAPKVESPATAALNTIPDGSKFHYASSKKVYTMTKVEDKIKVITEDNRSWFIKSEQELVRPVVIL